MLLRNIFLFILLNILLVFFECVYYSFLPFRILKIQNVTVLITLLEVFLEV